MNATRIKVVCQECGKRFSTANPNQQCPKCNGTDIEPEGI